MKQSWMALGSGLALVAVALFLGGCGATSYSRAGILGGGYGDKPEGVPGAYEIDFVGQSRSFDFVKGAAYYRAAEMTYNNNYRYFRVLKADDASDYNYSPNMGGATATQTDIPGIILHIQCYAQRPPEACYDAFQYLNMVKVPGTELPYTIAQRQADRAAGTYKP